MPAVLASIEPYLKERYAPKIRRQLNDEVLTLKRITGDGPGKISSDTEGKYVTFPIHVRRNSGIGSRVENAPLPVPGQQGYASARVQLKHGYGGIEITGQAIDMADEDPKAFANTVEEETSRLKEDLKKDLNRQIYGDGTGAISTVRAVVTSAVIPVVDARLFQLGAVVDIITPPSTVTAAARTITAVDLTVGANTITISGANVTTTVGMLVVRTGSVNAEITGFGSIIQNTGILYNINPSSEPEWKAVVRANGGTPRQLTEGLMTELTDAIRVNGGKTTVIFYSLGVRRSYANLLTQMRQVVNTTKFTGGFSGLAFTTDSGEIPVVADPDAPIGTAHFVNEDALTFYRDKPWSWLDRDGSMWKQRTDANGVYDKWYAHLVERHELATDRRNTHGKIVDLIES